MPDRIYGFIGLAMRAGKIASGSLPVEKAFASKKVFLMLLDEGLSENSAESYRKMAKQNGVPMLILPKDSLSDAIGKNGRMAAVVTEQGFAKQILKLASEAGLHIIGGACN